MSGSVTLPVTVTFLVGFGPTVALSVAPVRVPPPAGSDHWTVPALIGSAVRAWQYQVVPGTVVALGGLVFARPHVTAAAPCASTSLLRPSAAEPSSLTAVSTSGRRGSMRDCAVV